MVDTGQSPTKSLTNKVIDSYVIMVELLQFKKLMINFMRNELVIIVRLKMMKNVVLIGMPSSEKSTVGVILAKTLGIQFVDTDILIQNHKSSLLQKIIYDEGLDTFIDIEGKTLTSLDLTNHVIATGGSAVYSKEAMESLKKNGIIIYLRLGCKEIQRRLNNILTRGIVAKKDMSIHELFEERNPLYEKYADITVDCTNKDIEQVVNEITAILKDLGCASSS